MRAQQLLAPDDSDWGQGLSVAIDKGGGGHAVLVIWVRMQGVKY